MVSGLTSEECRSVALEMTMANEKIRCNWAGDVGSSMCEYHDSEWGVPKHGDRELFELLCLEGAQAGLSWNTILNRRDGYRAAFDGFDIATVASYDETRAEALRNDARIIRNRAKIRAIIDNASATLKLQASGESLDSFLWSFVGGAPQVINWTVMSEVPAETNSSQAMSKALKALGFRFVGPTICYAFMQSAGMVNDHILECFRYGEVAG
jgi:DNA-3-methyladenine glycosylase I